MLRTINAFMHLHVVRDETDRHHQRHQLLLVIADRQTDAMKRDTKASARLVIVDSYRRQNEIFSGWGIDAMKHLRLDLDGVVEEIKSFGWVHVDTRRFLDHQFFLVFGPR